MVVRFQNEDKYLVTAGEKLLLWKLRNHVEKRYLICVHKIVFWKIRISEELI